MKLLIVGSDQVWSIEKYYVQYLKEFGWNIHLFSAHDIFYNYYSRSIIKKLIFKIGLSAIYRKINRLFKLEVESFRPNVIWVFKGMEIFPETLKWAKELNIKLVNYNPDNPFLFSGKGSGNKNITNSLDQYDLHFTYNLQIKKRLEENYNVKVVWLPFGFDLDDKLFYRCDTLDEINSVCFLGNPDKKRASFIKSLADKGIRIALFGNHWNNFLSNHNVEIHLPVYGEEQWVTLRRYRVQLNLMRPHNEDSHNMRSFEVPGIGGIMLAPDTNEHRLFFESGKEIFLFKNVEDCFELIKELMSLSTEKAAAIRIAARTRSLNSGYSYKDRSRQVLTEIERLLNE